MAFQDWVLFCAASAAFLVFPGRPCLWILASRQAGGGRLAISAVLGTIIGYAVMASATIGAMQALALIDAPLFLLLAWPGMTLMMVIALRLVRAPLQTGPIADNDNLAQRRSVIVASRAALRASLNLRAILFLLALSSQMGNAFMPARGDFLRLEAVFIALASLSSVLQAIYPDAMKALLRRRSARLSPHIKGKTMLISARAVSAGYRRIAA
ncbi:hypothetical protein NAC44_17870 [Allorhizobium sp. BGMRC 0089]|uniref:hypothetical protein n=1 Tax=Allorhizobium sonneratiae TaxID=2934936 RepID=UPI002033EC4F|nr:hypothetical protein [Allorhizobium sonneratiae]MCM2294198.1 hypothetical protein [Allorhizobium sonneratiae]